MSERWFQAKKREPFYRQAKREGYRARSAYKLLQVQEKFNLVRSGDTVVDLGASPGGWSQVALEIVGAKGRVLGVDLAHVEGLSGAVFIRGDFTKPETVDKVRAALVKEGKSPIVQVVLSDMSPDISGQYSLDQAESAFLCESALSFAETVLDRGGNFLVKIFEGEDYPPFLQKLRDRFDLVKPYRPQATRKSSSEVYLVAKGYRGSNRGT